MDSYLVDLKSGGVNVPTVEHMFDATPANGTSEASQPRQHMVIAKYDEDVSWLHELPSNLDVTVYQSKDPNASHFVENFGNEASKYLSYIVDNYNNLPDTVAFMQAGRMDWHDPVPKDATMRRWDWGAAAAHGGMAFLPTAAPCIIEDSDPQAQDSEPEVAQMQEKRRRLVPDQERCVGVVEHSPPQMETVRSVWAEVFEPELGPLPKHWFTHCCAQFQVTSGAILHHPLEFYQRLLQFTLDHDRSLAGEMKKNHDEKRRDAGHVFEVLWALIFANPTNRVTIS